MAQLLRKTNLADIFSEARSGTIAHKNKKRITAVTHCLGTVDGIIKKNMPGKLFFFSIIYQFLCIVCPYFVPRCVAIYR